MKSVLLMSKSEITKGDFEKLLAWLDSDREKAAQKYYSIHRRLVQFFLGRRISSATDLADETIDRVMRKIDELSKNYQGNPTLYFYGVAKKILLEYSNTPQGLSLDADVPASRAEKDVFEEYYDCLEKCLKTLPAKNRKALIKYVCQDKPSKKVLKELEESLGVTVKLLRVRIFRIKKSLRDCVSKCLKKKKV